MLLPGAEPPSVAPSFLCLLPARHLRGLNDARPAMASHKSFVGNPPDIGFGHLIDAVYFLKESPPVPEKRLPQRELLRKSRVGAERTQQVRFYARLDHLQLVLGDVLAFQPLDFRPDRGAQFLW